MSAMIQREWRHYLDCMWLKNLVISFFDRMRNFWKTYICGCALTNAFFSCCAFLATSCLVTGTGSALQCQCSVSLFDIAWNVKYYIFVYNWFFIALLQDSQKLYWNDCKILWGEDSSIIHLTSYEMMARIIELLLYIFFFKNKCVECAISRPRHHFSYYLRFSHTLLSFLVACKCFLFERLKMALVLQLSLKLLWTQMIPLSKDIGGYLPFKWS